MAVLGLSLTAASITTSSLLLLAIACLTVQIWSYETSIVLLPGTPQVVGLKPYEFYEVLVPVDSLVSAENYYIRTSF